MKKNFILLALGATTSFASFSQLTTPGNGTKYDLAALSALDPTILSFDGTKYQLTDDLVISATDTLEVTTSDTLLLDSEKEITIEGSFIADPGSGNTKFFISSTDTLMPGDGFRFEEFSVGKIHNTEIVYTGGLKVLTEDFHIEDSYLAHNVAGSSTGAAISLSRGAAVIKNNTFYKNDLPGVSSGANQQVSAQIIGNVFEKNVQENQNRPQINMGPTGADTLRIIENTIIGDPNQIKVGGIAVSNFFGDDIYVEIENNEIRDNRYGMTISGVNATAMIRGNIIEDNNTQNDPMLGGSGIALSSSDDSHNIVARQNQIRGNLWGITLMTEASIDLGTANDLGGNVFANNGNNGNTFALFNNTPLDISAMGNCWIEGSPNADSVTIEEVISHTPDDANLGTVDFSEFTCSTVSTSSEELNTLSIYPNPAINEITIDNANEYNSAKIYNTSGRVFQTVQLENGHKTIQLDLPSGMYIVQLKGDSKVMTKKLIIE